MSGGGGRRNVDGTFVDARPGSVRMPQGITYWHGRVTGSWWAIVPGPVGPYLVEEPSEEHLATAVNWLLRHPTR